jgi:hypothetical protein
MSEETFIVSYYNSQGGLSRHEIQANDENHAYSVFASLNLGLISWICAKNLCRKSVDY